MVVGCCKIEVVEFFVRHIFLARVISGFWWFALLMLFLLGWLCNLVFWVCDLWVYGLVFGWILGLDCVKWGLRDLVFWVFFGFVGFLDFEVLGFSVGLSCLRLGLFVWVFQVWFCDLVLEFVVWFVVVFNLVFWVDFLGGLFLIFVDFGVLILFVFPFLGLSWVDCAGCDCGVYSLNFVFGFQVRDLLIWVTLWFDLGVFDWCGGFECGMILRRNFSALEWFWGFWWFCGLLGLWPVLWLVVCVCLICILNLVLVTLWAVYLGWFCWLGSLLSFCFDVCGCCFGLLVVGWVWVLWFCGLCLV